ncbi:pro-neuregulin-4, membrane-bound isoform isoform X1 [Neopelma chrysocephalum]|uniref:pro-neuregulin-4, membrane-bound isoform isoform X1 n=1 Tax=Neopelma chrysocephalum TaxID=114329 RepID=UPI000FCCF5D5|nr:pro-neuregulin-4, membrane-bound isoform isoform X1 [Neopelma chrysocephalum]
MLWCTLYPCRQKSSGAEKESPAVTGCEVRSQRENCAIITTGTQTRKIHYLPRTHVREVRVPVNAQHLKGESEGIKSSTGPDPEIRLYKALKDHFLPKLTNLICYFLHFKPLADKLKEAGNIVLKAKKEKSDFSSHRDMPLLYRELGGCVALLRAPSESLSPELCTAWGKTNHRQLLSDNFNMLLILRQSDLHFGILSPLKKEKACGHLKWKFRKEILIEDVRNKWAEVVLYKLLESPQLSRQIWNSYLMLPSVFALFGKQFVQKVRLNKPNPRLNANRVIYGTVVPVKERLLAVQTASNPLHLRTFQLPKLIGSVHKLCDCDVQIKMRSGYKFILRWSNATDSTG